MKPLGTGIDIALALPVAGAAAAYFVLAPKDGSFTASSQSPVSSGKDELARQRDAGAPPARPGAPVTIPQPQRGPGLPAPIPQPIAEKFDSWRVRCVLNREGRETCFVEQILRNDRGQPELALIYHRARDGKAPRFEIKPPWGLMLQAGLTFRVDSGPIARVPIAYCLATGCEASIEVNEALTADLVGATSITIGMVSAEGKQLFGKLGLEGFADAVKRLEQDAAK